MPGTLSLTKVMPAKPGFITREYAFVPSGSYTQGGAVGTPGETLNFLTALNPNGLARRTFGPLPALTTKDVYVAAVPAGYDAAVEVATTAPASSNMVLRFFSSGGSELSAGAYPTGLLTANVIIRVITPEKQG